MDREYLDEVLRRLAIDVGYRPEGWDDVEIADFRLLVQCARAARAEADLRNLRVLRLRSEAGCPKLARVRLSSSREVVLRFKDCGGRAAVALELVPVGLRACR